MKKKLIIPVLIATMLGTSIPAYAANFADINDVPWEGAKTYINAVADKGLMVGSDNAQGKRVFKPKDNLTYLECAQLVYTLFGDESGLTAYNSTIGTKWSTVLKGYKISEWAWPATSFCLENSIITISDVASFMNGTTAKKAARQDVAVMFGKGFEKAGYAQKQSFSFNDASKISSSALKYANLLGSLNILTGDNNKNFNPAALINRSEMAVIVSKTDDLLAGGSTTGTGTQTGTTTTPTGSGTVTGVVSTVVSYGDQYVLTMLTGKGAQSFMMSASTKVNYNNKTYGPEDIGESDTVVVAYNGTTVVTVVVTKDANDDIGTAKKEDKKDEEVKSTISGIIYSMNEDKMVVQKSNKTKVTYDGFEDSDIEVVIDGSSRSYRRLLNEYDDADRSDEINVVVYLDKDEEVIKIVATVDGGEVDGYIDNVTTKKIEIDNDDYYLNKDILTIKVNGVEIKLDKLIELVKEYDDFYAEAALDGEEQVISLVITSDDYEGEGITGPVERLYDDRIKIDGKFYDFPTDTSKITRIKLNGKTVTLTELEEAYDDLGDDDEMTAEIKLKNDYVDEIVAETNIETEEVRDNITSLSRKTMKIGNKEYDVDEEYVDVRVLNGNSNITTYSDLRELFDLAEETEIEVEAVIVDGEVTEMTGELLGFKDVRIYDVNSSGDSVKLGSNSVNFAYDVKSSCDIRIDNKRSDLSDLEYEADNNRVYADIEFNTRGEIVSIDATID